MLELKKNKTLELLSNDKGFDVSAILKKELGLLEEDVIYGLKGSLKGQETFLITTKNKLIVLLKTVEKYLIQTVGLEEILSVQAYESQGSESKVELIVRRTTNGTLTILGQDGSSVKKMARKLKILVAENR
jgi:hypothetical protein